MSRLSCYHGSPGAASDFDGMRPYLPGVDVVGLARSQGATDGFFLGYSWGTNPLLRDAVESRQCRGVIFLSPYLKPAPKRGSIYFALLRTLLSVAPLRRKFAQGFLTKTAAPAPVPPGYQKLQNAVEGALFEAVREKSLWEFDSRCGLDALAEVPILLIYGQEDAVDGTAESITLLRTRFPNAEVVAIPAGGHALPWTHTELVSQSIAGFIAKHGG
jgi:pimeloyl-ACP methyl ester carboxylesterase